MSRKRRRKSDAVESSAPASVADSATPLDTLSPRQGWGLFLGLTGLIALIVFWPYLVGQKLYLFKDIGSDTLNAFLPRLMHLAHYWRDSGMPGWSFNVGMGQNLFPNSMGGPELLLTTAGPEALPFLIGWLEVLKIFAAGGLVLAWLRLRGYEWVPAIFGGLGYAFCGSMIVGGGWYAFSAIAVYGALVPLGYEFFRMRGWWWAFVLTVAAIATYNVFNLAALGWFGLGYFLLRQFNDGAEWQAAGREAAILIGLSVLGLALSGFWSLEASAEILSSPRVGGDASYAGSLSETPIFSFGDQQFYGTIALRTLSNDLLGTGNGFGGWYNYLEAPMNYSTLLALLLIPQVFIFLDKRRRIVWGVGLGIVLLVQLLPYFRHVFWLFSGNYFRSLSTLISWGYLILAVRALQGIAAERRVNMPLLLGTAAILLIGLFFPWSHKGEPLVVQSGLRGFCMVIIVAQAGLVWALASGRNRFAAQAGILGVLALEIAVLSFTPVNNRDVVTAEEWKDSGYNDVSVQALAKIREQDEGFYRVHKYYHSTPAMHSSINDAQIQGFYGTSSYHSFNQPNYLRFLAGLGLIDPKKEFQSRWAQGLRGRHALEMFASVKYVLMKEEPTGFLAEGERIGQVDDVRIVKLPTFLGLGIIYDSAIRRSEFATIPSQQRGLSLLKAPVIEDDSDAAGLKLLTVANLATLGTPTQSVLLTEHGQNHIASEVDLASPSLVVFSIPLDGGWTATLDGEPVAIERVNFGLMGLRVPAGTHKVALQYAPPLRGKGLALSLFGLLACACLWGWQRRQITKEDE